MQPFYEKMSENFDVQKLHFKIVMRKLLRYY